jgi:hypothetical protein
MKKAILALFAAVALAGAQPSGSKVYVVTFDPNSTIRMSATELSVLYESELRPRVAAQIAEAIAALPPAGITQATLDAAIADARAQVLQATFQQMVAADTATAHNLEQQMLTRLTAGLQLRLTELQETP